MIQDIKSFFHRVAHTFRWANFIWKSHIYDQDIFLLNVMEFSLKEALLTFNEEGEDGAVISSQIKESLNLLRLYMEDNFLQELPEYVLFREKVGERTNEYMDPLTEKVYKNRGDVPLPPSGLVTYKIVPKYSKCVSPEENELAEEEEWGLVKKAVKQRHSTKTKFFNLLSDKIEGWWI